MGTLFFCRVVLKQKHLIWENDTTKHNDLHRLLATQYKSIENKSKKICEDMFPFTRPFFYHFAFLCLDIKVTN